MPRLTDEQVAVETRARLTALAEEFFALLAACGVDTTGSTNEGAMVGAAQDVLALIASAKITARLPGGT